MTDEEREQIEHAEVTVGRAQRFYQILQDLDFDDAIDEAKEARDEEVTGRPVGIAEQAAHDQGQSLEEEAEEAADPGSSPGQQVAIGVNEFMDSLMLEGKLAEMAEVMLELPDGVAPEDVPVDVVANAFPPFLSAYADVISKVGGTKAAMVSRSSPRGGQIPSDET